MNSYDVKFRKRTIGYWESGHTCRETCKIFGISTNTLSVWVKKLIETGSIQAPPPKTKPKKIDPVKLSEYLLERPYAYQTEIAEHFNCKQPSVAAYLKKHGYTRKKR